MHTIPLDTVALQRRKKNSRVLFWQAFDKVKIIRQYIPGALLTLSFGLADCFGMPSFFVFSLWLAAVQAKGRPIKGSAAGMIGWIILRMLWGLDTAFGLISVYGLMTCFIRKPLARKSGMYVLQCIILLLCMLLCWRSIETAEEALRMVGGAILSICIMPAMLRSTELGVREMDGKMEDDILCLCIPAIIILGGAAHVSLFSVNFGLAMAGIMVLMIGWSCGALMGAAAGIGMGFAVVGGGQHVVHMVYMPMAGMLCGCFRGRRRWAAGAVYAGAAVSLVYILMQQLPGFLSVNVLVSVLSFLLIPEKRMKLWKKHLMRLQWEKPKDNEFLRIRMQQWVNCIHKLAQALPLAEMPMSSLDEECEALTEKLCDQCDRLPICWHEAYEKTKQGMHAILACGDIQLPLINKHFDQCQRISKMPGLLEEIHQRRNAIIDRNRVAAYDRDMMETHLLALSQAAQLISLEGMNTDEEEKEWERLIKDGMERMHYAGSVLFAKKVDGHMMIGLHGDGMTIQPAVVQRIIRQIQISLGKNMQLSEQKSNRLILEEIPVYDLMAGHATTNAVVVENGCVPANGDAVLVRAINGGKIIFAISDGMGHGVQARNESKRTLEMLAVCLQAGYDGEQTMRVVNGAMLNATGGESFATLDMGIIDLWTGETKISKMGACSSFIIQGQKISRLTGEALPLGILENVYPAEKVIQLEEEDRILMMTDGVADLFATDDEVIRLIHKYLHDVPQTMAEMILQDALERQMFAPADDMTVLCVQLIQRYPARQNKKSIPA